MADQDGHFDHPGALEAADEEEGDVGDEGVEELEPVHALPRDEDGADQEHGEACMMVRRSWNRQLAWPVAGEQSEEPLVTSHGLAKTAASTTHRHAARQRSAESLSLRIVISGTSLRAVITVST